MNAEEIITDSIKLKKMLLDAQYIASIESIVQALKTSTKNGNKVLVAGNGGSAADSQHFAEELSGHFVTERNGTPTETVALTTNSSMITAFGNDFGFEHIFERQIEALGRKGDIFFGISTSGRSKNLILALKQCKKQGLFTIGLLGKDGGEMKSLCDLYLIVPSEDTQRIQEAHILILHIICETFCS